MSRSFRKILIIKTGFSEVLDRGISTTVSLGDVLACTALLHLYKQDQVTWVTSWSARQLLQNNPYIQNLLIFGPAAFRQIAHESFDILVNLEKDIGLCVFLREVKAKKRYGFYFDEHLHDISTHKRASRYLLAGQENHREIDKTFWEILFETVGEVWRGEGLVLGRAQKAAIKFDVGFNYSVGTKWPTKAWPMQSWEALQELLKSRYSISWQQGHKNLFRYIDWLDSCRLVVTGDSLGQALALALGKKVVALYGPTDFRRMQKMKNILMAVSTLACPHMPCYLPVCKNDQFCMNFISPQKVAALCEESLEGEIPLLRRISEGVKA